MVAKLKLGLILIVRFPGLAFEWKSHAFHLVQISHCGDMQILKVETTPTSTLPLMNGGQ